MDRRLDAPVLARGAIGIKTPEFRLLAACCRWPPSQPGAAAIHEAAAEIRDWDSFLWLAKRHRVVGLVHEALALTGRSLPASTLNALAAAAQRIARRNLILGGETIRLQRALEDGNIPCLALKGAALAQLAYGSLRTKHARDVDLLVPPEQAEAALHILQDAGYALSYPAKHLSKAQSRAVFRYAREVQLVHRGNNARVELQWRPTANPLLLKGLDAHAATQTVALGDAGVRTLTRDDLFAYLCVHGAQHAWSRLKWLADFNAVASANRYDILHLYRYAQYIGAGHCAGQALVLCNELFALELPETVKAELADKNRLRRLATIAISTMTDRFAEAEAGRSFASIMRVTLAQFLLGEGWAFFGAQCRVESIRILDLVEVPLPPTMQFLYPFLRLPLWLWRRAKAAAAHAPRSGT
jgi:hypothetical protein